MSNFIEFANNSLTLDQNVEFVIRIVLAGVLGALIGLERSWHQKEAGIRTHCIIACTAAAFMILSKYAFLDMEDPGDPARLAAQVVGGISFIGAGVIFKDETGIKGLTTAAGMWATAAVGLAIGAGLYCVGLVEAAIVVAIQITFHRYPIGNDATMVQEINVTMADIPSVQQAVQALIDRHEGQIESSDIVRKNDMLTLNMMVRLEVPITTEEVLVLLEECPGISRISV